MLAGAVGATAVYAANEGSDPAAGTDEPAIEENAGSESDDVQKDETVYVLAGASGSVNKVIVSDHLKNPDSRNALTETSDLTGVQNVKGDESFTENGGERTWNAAGNDIYYQGTTNSELPIDINVKYALNGTEMSAESMLGKSGRVTIRFDYTNNKSEEMTINGEKTEIYVPFAAITGMMLDNDKFRNIEVTNGKLINDGDRSFIVGTAFPGLSESLDVNSDKIKIPGYFEVSADVTDFEMTNTITIATNEVFNDIDIDLSEKEKDLTTDIDKLSDAMNRLIDGSDKLHDGLAELLDKSSALTDGVGALSDGADQLKDGAEKVNDGAAQLYTGSTKLSAGLDELTSNNETLTAGSKQVFESLIDMANRQLAASGITGYTLTIDNYGETIDKIIASLDTDNVLKTAKDTAKKQVTEAVEAKRGTVETEVTKAVKEQVSEKVNEAVKAAVTEKVNEAVKAKVSEKVNEAVEAKVTEKVTEAVKAAVSEKVNETVKAAVTEKVNEGVKAKVLEGVLAAQNMTPDSYKQAVEAGLIDEAAQTKIAAAVDQQMQTAEVKAQAEALVEQQMQSAEVKAQAEAALDQQMQSDEVKAMIKTKTEEQMKSAEVKAQAEAALEEQMKSAEIKKQTEDAIKEQMASAEVKAQAEAALAEQMKSDDIKALITKTTNDKVTELIDENYNSKDVQDKIKAGLSTAKEGVAKLHDLKTQLDSYNTFYTGLAQYTDGVAQAADGAKQVKDGLGELNTGTGALADGTQKLYDGISELDGKVPALIDGITQLSDGSGELADGCREFNDEGINKIISIVDGDLGKLIDRTNAISDVSDRYQTFSGGDGCVKFIYRTEAVETK